MVCLSSHGPNSEKLLRYGSRLAGRLNRNWYAVYVQTPSEEATVIDAHTQRILSDTLTLAKQLGAVVFTYKGEDIVDTILRFAKEYRVGHIVVGRSHPKPFWKRIGKNKAIVANLVNAARGVTIVVIDPCEEKSRLVKPLVEVPEGMPPTATSPKTVTPPLEQPTFSQSLSAQRIVIWKHPVLKEEVLRALVAVIAKERGIEDREALFSDIMKREEQGSTFFNEGVAFPHVRFEGLAAPIVALGLTREGVTDVSTEKPIEIVFLIISPAQAPDTQVKLLGLASRAAQNRHLLQSLRSARTPEEAMRMILDWEMPDESRPTSGPK
jgi:two-component system sensor histidine kinase KdpD